MKNNDSGIEELLEVLKTNPEIISALVFDPDSVKRLLNSKAARKLVLGVKFKNFITYVTSASNGGPVARCIDKTKVISPCCPGGSRRARVDGVKR
jgi:hypothetical protein